MMKNTEQKQFAATAEGQAIAYPDFDMTPPEDLKGGILSLIREARGLIEDSPEFRSWKGKYFDPSTDYKANFEERLKLLVKNNKTYCPLAFQYFELAVYEDEIDDIKDPAYYYTLRKLVSDLKKKKRPREEDSILPFRYKTSREITRLSTRPRKKGQDLFSLLTDEEDKKSYEEIKERGGYVSPLTSGIVVSVLGNKVIKALQRCLYAQSWRYGRKEGEGLPEDVVTANIGEGHKDEEGVKDSSFICTDPYSLTKMVLGGKTIGGDNVKQVMQTLSELDNTFAYNDKDRSYYRLLTIEKITKGTANTPGEIFIALRSIFWKGMENDYINTRADELQLLSGITSNLSLRLYDVLKELDSYNLPTQQKSGYVQIKKSNLMERIAVKKSYDKNPKRAKDDFLSAVKDMKKIGIITKTEERGGNILFYIPSSWRKGTEGEGQRP